MNTSSDFPATARSGSSQFLALVYWLIVILPLGWGVFQTVEKSKPLFRVTSTQVVAAPPGAAATPPEK